MVLHALIPWLPGSIFIHAPGKVNKILQCGDGAGETMTATFAGVSGIKRWTV
jgi:hypothetical protein